LANTIVWNKHDYVVKMRERINHPACWRDVLNVKVADVRTIVNASLTAATEPAVDTGTRGTAYTYNDAILLADTLTIDQYRVIPVLIDEADRHQQSYLGQMEIATYQGKKFTEYLEAQMLAQFASWTDFGAGDLANTSTDDATQITVSGTNIDNIIRAIKRKLYKNNGVDFAAEKGIFIVWRPTDFEFLEEFVQANGFTEADLALKNGIPVEKAFKYLGVYHYLSNEHTANHVFAGIRGMGELGILRSTFGRVKYIEDPGLVSGLGVVSRLDYGWNFPAYHAQFVMDVNVA